MKLSGFLLIAATLIAGNAAAESVEQWLLRMDHAVASISYTGTLISMGNNRVDTLRILHRVDDRGVRERIYALDGPAREVLRDRDQVTCLISGQASVVVNNPFPSQLLPRIPLEDILGPDSVYRIQAAGSGRVAGREARIIEILPTDRFRYGRRLWLDQSTAMLLRSVLFDAGGEVVETLSFVDIELGASISDQELLPELENPSRIARYQETGQNAAGVAASQTPSWIPEALPEGFRLTSVGRGGVADQAYEHLLFSDGLASFSIYIEPEGSGSISEQLETLGAMHIYTGSIDGRMITVVGEVPAPTVSMIGRHLRRLEYPVLRHLD
ncbi:MAG: MucB/RseB C-terminal domain-containing protein [Xanthomonadaceae bacterium]|nr:MucB/RseB C-terminal domain-containing protein [Xanthomonadaceae bacterium]